MTGFSSDTRVARFLAGLLLACASGLAALAQSPRTSNQHQAHPVNPDAAQIEAYLGSLGAALDIDGNNLADALTDGLLVMRRLFGLSGNAMTAGAICLV